MWEIIGLLLLAIAVVMGFCFLCDYLSDFNSSYTKSPKTKRNRKTDYEAEKAKSIYDATNKSLKLNMMQMDSLRQMEEAARKHQE